MFILESGNTFLSSNYVKERAIIQCELSPIPPSPFGEIVKHNISHVIQKKTILHIKLRDNKQGRALVLHKVLQNTSSLKLLSHPSFKAEN